VPGPAGKSQGQPQAPHILVHVFMRGQLKQLVSRIYFPGEPANAKDPVLALVPAQRRATLIARKRDKKGVLEWNVILRRTRRFSLTGSRWRATDDGSWSRNLRGARADERPDRTLREPAGYSVYHNATCWWSAAGLRAPQRWRRGVSPR
jgi:hypothetical protein